MEDGSEDKEFDYGNFFSVLMYYGHMSKYEIMHSSMPFLYYIYKNYIDRACENLGVSNHSDDDEDKTSDIEYPTEFYKISENDRKNTMTSLSNDDEFKKRFGAFIKNDT